MSKYRLVFKGELTGELPRETCLRRLSRTFAEDPARLGMRLFSGRRVVIKRTEDHEVARRYLQIFEDAGARLILETEGVELSPPRQDPEPAPPRQPARPPEPDVKMTRKREAMKPPSPSDAAETRERVAVSDTDDRLARREMRRRRRGKRR